MHRLVTGRSTDMNKAMDTKSSCPDIKYLGGNAKEEEGGFGGRVTILDGSFASQLGRHVHKKIDGDPLWSARFLAEDPEAVVKTHLDFLRAGADIISTNTYQASVGAFVKYLDVSEGTALQYIRDAVSHAKAAVNIYKSDIGQGEETSSNLESLEIDSKFLVHGNDDKRRFPLIAGSVGAYGASLHDGSEYQGKYVDSVSVEELSQWHRPRMEALVEEKVDFLAFETIPALQEAKVLLQMLIQEFPGQKAWLSFSSQDGERTSYGDEIEHAVKDCLELGGGQLVAVGANCLSPHLATTLLTKINRVSSDFNVPLIMYPNSGETWHPYKGWQDQHLCTPIKVHVCKWLDLGVRYIGGCCRVHAEDLVDIKEEVEAWLQKQPPQMKGKENFA